MTIGRTLQTSDNGRRIVIIGAGFSGSLLDMHLLRCSRLDDHVINYSGPLSGISQIPAQLTRASLSEALRDPIP